MIESRIERNSRHHPVLLGGSRGNRIRSEPVTDIPVGADSNHQHSGPTAAPRDEEVAGFTEGGALKALPVPPVPSDRLAPCQVKAEDASVAFDGIERPRNIG
jgi:hypothetical protein